MMYFSAHYSDREPEYFNASDWLGAAIHGSSLGAMITLYWLADDDVFAQPDLVALDATGKGNEGQ